MTTRYYALVLNSRPLDDPYSIFRENDGESDYRTEIWNPETGRWVEDMSLTAYTLMGEPGAEEISKEKVDEIRRRWRSGSRTGSTR